MDIGIIETKVDLGEGEWIDDIPDMEDIQFRVRSTNYKPFRVATAGLARRSGKKLNTDEGLNSFNIASGKPLAEHILLDWKGVTSGGKPLKFSKEQAVAILTAEDDFGIGAKFRRGVEWAGDQVADRIAGKAKEAAGN
jgi:flavodoxin